MDTRRLRKSRPTKALCSALLVAALLPYGCALHRTSRERLAAANSTMRSPVALQDEADALQHLPMQASASHSPPSPASAPKPAPTAVAAQQPRSTAQREQTPLPQAAAQVPVSPPRAPAAQLARVEPRIARPASKPRVIHANATSFDRHVLQADVPVLVDFYASWCGPCKALAPTIDELAAESPHARVVKIDIDDSPELASRYGVSSVPSLMVFKDGRITAKQTGVASKAKLAAMLQ